jgi:hypothetical protein
VNYVDDLMAFESLPVGTESTADGWTVPGGADDERARRILRPVVASEIVPSDRPAANVHLPSHPAGQLLWFDLSCDALRTLGTSADYAAVIPRDVAGELWRVITNAFRPGATPRAVYERMADDLGARLAAAAAKDAGAARSIYLAHWAANHGLLAWGLTTVEDL